MLGRGCRRCCWFRCTRLRCHECPCERALGAGWGRPAPIPLLLLLLLLLPLLARQTLWPARAALLAALLVLLLLRGHGSTRYCRGAFVLAPCLERQVHAVLLQLHPCRHDAAQAARPLLQAVLALLLVHPAAILIDLLKGPLEAGKPARRLRLEEW